MQSSAPSIVTHQQPTHLWDYWGIIMKRLWLVLLFCAVSVGVAWAVTESQQPLYSATATIEIVPPSQLGGDPFAPLMTGDGPYLETQIDKLKMRETIERAVRSQKLAQKRAFQGKSEGDIVRMAAGRVDVRPRRQRLLLDVSVVGPDPAVLPLLADALVLEFRDMQRSESRQRREVAKKELEDRKARLSLDRRMAAQEKRMQLESKQFDENTFPMAYTREHERLLTRTRQRDEVSDRISQNRATYDHMRAARESKEDPLTALLQIRTIQENAEVRDITRAIESLRDQQEDLRRRGIGTSMGEWQQIEREIERKQAQKQRAVFAAADWFIVEYQSDEGVLVDLDRQIQVINASVTQIVTLKATVDEKNELIAACDAEIESTDKQLQPILASQIEEREAVKLIQPAVEPTTPISPNRSTNLTLGAVIGFIGGVALAFLLDYLDDTIRTKDELAKIADVPLLGIVPNIEGRTSDVQKRDLFAHHQPKSTISEAYRGVRTALTLSARGPMQKAIVLTSAGPREGKTTTAINLATVLAYAGARVLVVDGDLRKPRIHKSFGLPNARGLTNLIIGEDDPLTHCMATAVDRVDVLPSGPIPPNPSELLGHPRMREILRRLRDHYDHVIVDTPPIGAVTDAAVLATIVDGVVLVVHAGKTRRQIVMRGIEQLRYINAPIVGVILNNLRIGRIRYYPGYYHYYYYYASHYGADEPDAAPPPVPGSAASRGDDAG